MHNIEVSKSILTLGHLISDILQPGGRRLKGQDQRSTISSFVLGLAGAGVAAVASNFGVVEVASLGIARLACPAIHVEISAAKFPETAYTDELGRNVLDESTARKLILREIERTPGIDALEISVNLNISLEFAADVVGKLTEEEVVGTYTDA